MYCREPSASQPRPRSFRDHGLTILFTFSIVLLFLLIDVTVGLHIITISARVAWAAMSCSAALFDVVTGPHREIVGAIFDMPVNVSTLSAA